MPVPTGAPPRVGRSAAVPPCAARLLATALAVCLALFILPPRSVWADEPDSGPPAAPVAWATPPPVADAAPGAVPVDRSEEGPGLLPLWLRDPSRWAADLFAETLVSLLRTVAEFLRRAVDAVLRSPANVIAQTPPEVSYASPTVRGLWEVSRAIANASLALVALWGGFNLMAREHIGAAYHDLSELLSRLAVGGLLVNTSLWWGRLAVDANNALCRAFGEATLPAWQQADQLDQAIGNVLAGLIYLVVGALLLLQQLMRLALVDALLVAAPLGLACWVLPQTQGWARRWSSTFSTAVFVQFVQALALKLGGSLMLELAPRAEDAQVVDLLLGVAVLALTLKLPRLLRGDAGDGLGFARYYAYRRGARAIDTVRGAVTGGKGGA